MPFGAIWAGIKLIAGKKIVQQAAVAGASQLLGATLTRRSAKKEAARVAAANRAEAARIQKINEAKAAQAQKQNTQVRQNYYKNVVSDAQAAGINPLTALRTGGAAGYATAVAGTMANSVMLEGIYQAPTLSRNPLAAGLEAATNTYLSELTRQKQYTHETRMDELNRALKVATLKSMNAELSRDPRLPPLDQRHNYVLDEAGQFVLDNEGYAIRREEFASKAMQSDYRTIGADGKTYVVRSANTEHLDTSLNEAKGGAALIFGGGAVGQFLTRNTSGGMPRMNENWGDIPFASDVEKRGNRLRLHINNFAN
jgi:hypothetical protein